MKEEKAKRERVKRDPDKRAGPVATLMAEIRKQVEASEESSGMLDLTGLDAAEIEALIAEMNEDV